MLRDACGYKLANDGHDTRAIQAYFVHRNIQTRSLCRFGAAPVQGIFSRLIHRAIDKFGQAAHLSGQPLESSEVPMLKAFCLVAPSVRFSFFAISEAGFFRRAIVFSARTCSVVQARRTFAFLAIVASR
jgi:hypothetical protein